MTDKIRKWEKRGSLPLSDHRIFKLREVFLAGKIAEAEAGGDFEALEQLQRELTSNKKTLESDLEEKKEAARNR